MWFSSSVYTLYMYYFFIALDCVLAASFYRVEYFLYIVQLIVLLSAIYSNVFSKFNPTVVQDGSQYSRYCR